MPRTSPFETHANKYEEWFDKHPDIYQSELRALKALLPKSNAGIEIGVGTGRFAAPLGITIGVEPSKAMGQVARKRGIDVITGVGEALPFAEAQFDFALMVTTICFLNDIDASFQEAYRVLRPEGALIIGFIDRNSRLGKIYQEQKKDNVFYKEATFYSVDEVISRLQEAKFRDFTFVQTLFEEMHNAAGRQPFREGYGEGSFIGIRGWK